MMQKSIHVAFFLILCLRVQSFSLDFEKIENTNPVLYGTEQCKNVLTKNAGLIMFPAATKFLTASSQICRIRVDKAEAIHLMFRRQQKTYGGINRNVSNVFHIAIYDQLPGQTQRPLDEWRMDEGNYLKVVHSREIWLVVVFSETNVTQNHDFDWLIAYVAQMSGIIPRCDFTKLDLPANGILVSGTNDIFGLVVNLQCLDGFVRQGDEEFAVCSVVGDALSWIVSGSVCSSICLHPPVVQHASAYIETNRLTAVSGERKSADDMTDMRSAARTNIQVSYICHEPFVAKGLTSLQCGYDVLGVPRWFGSPPSCLIPDCSMTIILRKSSGSLVNPLYPRRHLSGGSLTCLWEISSPDDSYIHLTVTDLDLPDLPGVEVLVFDNESTRPHQLLRLTNQSHLVGIDIKTSKITVRYQGPPNEVRGHRGFYIRYVMKSRGSRHRRNINNGKLEVSLPTSLTPDTTTLAALSETTSDRSSTSVSSDVVIATTTSAAVNTETNQQPTVHTARPPKKQSSDPTVVHSTKLSTEEQTFNSSGDSSTNATRTAELSSTMGTNVTPDLHSNQPTNVPTDQYREYSTSLSTEQSTEQSSEQPTQPTSQSAILSTEHQQDTTSEPSTVQQNDTTLEPSTEQQQNTTSEPSTEQQQDTTSEPSTEQQHDITSEPSTEQQQNTTSEPSTRNSSETTPYISTLPQNATVLASGEDSNDDWKIAVGIIIPVLFLILVLVGVYICYRKKYPVRMIIGREFAKFSNPNYSRRSHAPTLVREDADFYFSNGGTLGATTEEFNPVNNKIMYDNMGFIRDECTDEDEKERTFLQNKSWLFKKTSGEPKTTVQVVSETTAESSFITRSLFTAAQDPGEDRRDKRAYTDTDIVEILADEGPTPTPMPRTKKKANSVSSVVSNTDQPKEQIGASDMLDNNGKFANVLGSSRSGNKGLPDNNQQDVNEPRNKDDINSYMINPLRLFNQPTFDEVWAEVKARSKSLSIELTPNNRARSLSFDPSKSARKGSLHDDLHAVSHLASLVARRFPLAHSNENSKITASVVDVDIRDRDSSFTSSVIADEDSDESLSKERKVSCNSISSLNSDSYLVTDFEESVMTDSHKNVEQANEAIGAGDNDRFLEENSSKDGEFIARNGIQLENVNEDSSSNDVKYDIQRSLSTSLDRSNSEDLDDIDHSISRDKVDQHESFQTLSESTKKQEAVVTTDKSTTSDTTGNMSIGATSEKHCLNAAKGTTFPRSESSSSASGEEEAANRNPTKSSPSKSKTALVHPMTIPTNKEGTNDVARNAITVLKLSDIDRQAYDHPPEYSIALNDASSGDGQMQLALSSSHRKKSSSSSIESLDGSSESSRGVSTDDENEATSYTFSDNLNNDKIGKLSRDTKEQQVLFVSTSPAAVSPPLQLQLDVHGGSQTFTGSENPDPKILNISKLQFSDSSSDSCDISPRKDTLLLSSIPPSIDYYMHTEKNSSSRNIDNVDDNVGDKSDNDEYTNSGDDNREVGGAKTMLLSDNSTGTYILDNDGVADDDIDV